MRFYDAVVVGLGAHGSSTLFHLAQKGVKVLGIDRYNPGHDMGSSHGHSRITRLAYAEGPGYVPLLRRSYDLFLSLQEQAGEALFEKTGMLDIGKGFPRALHSAQLHSLPHTVMTGKQVNSAFPGYNLPNDMQALHQADGGILTPEVIIKVRDMERIQAAAAVFAAGPWISSLVPELKELCVPVRQVVGWFDCKGPDAFSSVNYPVFILEDNVGNWYGFPQQQRQHSGPPGFKIGLYNHLKETVPLPDTVSRVVTPADESALRACLQSYFPSANGKLSDSSVCMFTNTPDGHFLIDRHPSHPSIILCSACSGHGFKMSSGIGQHIASMVVEGGVGDKAAGLELRMHRIDATRPGHAQFMSNFA
ncbi:MAG: hypothetical protein WDW38_008841 [Sanguina aurantia]